MIFLNTHIEKDMIRKETQTDPAQVHMKKHEITTARRITRFTHGLL